MQNSMNHNRPLLLISNDDGYQAKGIRSLVDMLACSADIIVCAPEAAMSGYSCAFSATTPLRLTRRTFPASLLPPSASVQVWSCSGTPVDCVKMALSELMPRRPDMVIGGINHGDNSSVNAHYSGTMGITLEGCMKYIPSVAFSLCDFSEDADFEPLRPLVVSIVRKVLTGGLPIGVCLNVNFPKQHPYQGVRVCRMSRGSWCNELSKCHHPRGYDYWWMVGSYRNDEPEADDTDKWAVEHGYVAITPTQIDLTAYHAIDLVRAWDLNSNPVNSK